MAVINLMKSERRTHQRTKHIDARYFYARELTEKLDIELIWIPNHLMIADLLTKPVLGMLFTTLTAYMTGNKEWNIADKKC